MELINSSNFPDQDARIAGLERQHEADQALIQTLQADTKIDRDKIEHLKIALLTARRIGTAMGVLMAHRKVTEAAAFELLSETSQRTHRKLRDVAQDVLETGTLPDSE